MADPVSFRADYPEVHSLEIVNYTGEWRIPAIEEPAPRPKATETDARNSVSLDLASFIRQLTNEVILLSSQTLPFFKLSITIAASFGRFLEVHGRSDDKFKQSEFRMW
jgi:hypothetical protein